MKFSSMLLYVNDAFPTIQVFQEILQQGTTLYRKGNFLYTVEQELIDDRFFWMYFQYDNEFLYTDTVVDTLDNSAKSNPRPKNQVEMRNQVFACYDMDRNLLYLSDTAKKGTITDYINEMIHQPVRVKNVYKSIDEFISAAKYLKSVVFTQKRSLYTYSEANDSIFQKQANLFGLDLPDRSKLRLDYGANPIGMVKNTLQNWKMKHDSGEFEEVIVVGLDDFGFESTFDFSSMVSFIEFDLPRDDNYRYNSESVKVLLLSKLRS